MNPNQPPNYPPGQYPQYPPMYPGVMPQHPQHPQHPHYMQQGTPQYPTQQPNYMNIQIKPEPVWSQDSRYGMAPQYPIGQMPHLDMTMEARNANAPTPSQYLPSSSGGSGAGSLLAQHLSSAPAPPGYPSSSSSQQPSHLHQLLQQPAYPTGPGSQQLQQQQQQIAEQQRMMAMRQQQTQAAQQAAQQQAQQAQMQQAQQQAFQSAQEAYQAQQASRQQQSQNYLQPDSSSHVTAAFPPSASSSHTAYSQMQDMPPASHNLPPPTFRRQESDKPANLDKFTTGQLCVMGRELASDLNQKTYALAQMLKKVMERKSLAQGENPNDLSMTCSMNLERMSEIRQAIEKRRPEGWKRLTGDDYIELMLDDSEIPPEDEMSEEQKAKRADLARRMPILMSKKPPNEGDVMYQGRWIPAELHAKYMIFEENKKKIKAMTHELKNLSWKIDVTSPGHLKRVDQTKISKKREEREQ